MSLVEPTTTQRELQQQHIERRLRLAAKAVPDNPINLKTPKNYVPRIKTILSPYSPPDPPSGLNWPSLEPWGAMPDPDWALAIDSRVPPNFIHHIKKMVGNYFEFSVAQIDGYDRRVEYVIPRHIAMYLAKTLMGASLHKIGRKFGNKDHTTALNALKKIPIRMRKDQDLCLAIVDLEEKLSDKIKQWRMTQAV